MSWSLADSEKECDLQDALRAADNRYAAGHWPTVAADLAREVRRLRALVAALEGRCDNDPCMVCDGDE